MISQGRLFETAKPFVVCSETGCKQRPIAKGLCPRHYDQKRWREQPELRAKTKRRVKEAYGKRRNDPEWMERKRKYERKTRPKWMADNLHKIRPQRRAYTRRWKYGITEEQFEAMKQGQGGVCAICKKAPQPTGRNHAADGWCIDHDKKCCPGNKSCGKCIRSLLCFKCNTALGGFDDDPVVMEAAIRYVREHGAKVRLAA